MGNTARVPVAKTNPRRTLLVSLGALLFATVLLAAVIVLNGARTSGNSEQFDLLGVDTVLGHQDQDGVPTCLNDPATGDRPICLFHTGGDDDEGWVAYDAQVDGCAFEVLSPEATELVDSCTGDAYPFTGEGLLQYDVTVADGRLVIDLGGDDEDGSTTTSSTSTTAAERTTSTNP